MNNRIRMAVVVNAIYLLAVLWQEASAVTILALFWVENALGFIAHIVLAEAHWHRTHDRRHYSGDVDGKPTRHSFTFMMHAGTFLLGHGILVLALAVAQMPSLGDKARWQADASDIGLGCLVLLVLTVVGALLERSKLTDFFDIEQHSRRHYARVIGMQVIVILGLVTMSYLGPLGMVLTVVTVKGMIDVYFARYG